MTARADAVVIGSGPNGLAAAIRLAEAGREVVVLEAADAPGGAVRTEELTLPGFQHDTFSSVYPAAVASPVFARMPLAEHGLEWVHPEACYAAPLPNGEGDTIWLATGLPMGYDLGQTDATTALLRRDFQRQVEIKGTTPYSDSLAVEIDGTTHYFANRAVVLTFDHTNWDDLQTVYLYAPDDTRAEGDRVVGYRLLAFYP